MAPGSYQKLLLLRELESRPGLGPGVQDLRGIRCEVQPRLERCQEQPGSRAEFAQRGLLATGLRFFHALDSSC